MNNRISKRDYLLISAYLDDQVSQKERAYIESRLNSNPELRKELQEISKTRLLLRQTPKLRAPHNYFINPKVAPVSRRRSSALRLAPTMGIVSAVATILFTLVIFGQNLINPVGPVALAPEPETPVEALSAQSEVQRNAESAAAPMEEPPLAAMQAPSNLSPEPSVPAPTAEIVGTLKESVTEAATPTTIYLYALPPTATPEGQGIILETSPVGGGMTCDEYLRKYGSYPTPGTMDDCPPLTSTPGTITLDNFPASSPAPTSTPTPSETPTPTSTQTPTSTESPSPTPTATLAPTEIPPEALSAAPAAPAEDSGTTAKIPPEAATGPSAQSVPVEQPAPTQNTEFLRYILLAAEISLATIAIGTGITAIILRLRAGR